MSSLVLVEGRANVETIQGPGFHGIGRIGFIVSQYIAEHRNGAVLGVINPLVGDDGVRGVDLGESTLDWEPVGLPTGSCHKSLCHDPGDYRERKTVVQSSASFL